MSNPATGDVDGTAYSPTSSQPADVAHKSHVTPTAANPRRHPAPHSCPVHSPQQLYTPCGNRRGIRTPPAAAAPEDVLLRAPSSGGIPRYRPSLLKSTQRPSSAIHRGRAIQDYQCERGWWNHRNTFSRTAPGEFLRVPSPSGAYKL